MRRSTEAFTSQINDEIIQKQNTSSSSHTLTQCRVFLLTHRDIFQISQTDGKLWWQTKQQQTLWSKLQSPGRPSAKNRWSRARPATTNPAQGKTKHSDSSWMTVYLDVSSVFLPAERGHLTALSCWMMHYTLPVSLTLCVVSGHHTPWMIHPLVCSQKERDKTNLWQEGTAVCVMPVSEVGGNTRVHIQPVFVWIR